MNAKAKGSRTEHKSIALLESQGYKCTRAAASLGVFDIIAIGPTDVQLIQCKSNRWPGAEEMETMRQFPAPFNCVKAVHRWKDRQPEPDVKIVH
jgi:Holliday junction resolvase